MASAWPELLGTERLKALDHETVQHQLLKAEAAQREVRSLAYQMRAARFPAHRDLAGFNFAESTVDQALVRELHQMKFLESANNSSWSAGPAPARRTWPRVWAMRRSGRRPLARPGRWPTS
jgi:DNA replication protein DnaC